MLRGIDVSSYKSDLVVGNVVADFVIAKATGGTGYVDPSCDPFVQAAVVNGRLFGVYHYRGDGFGYAQPEAEANFFVDNCMGYVGKGLLILDWERGGNPDVSDVGWAMIWLRAVEARTGVKPIIYMSLSIVQAYDWSPVIQSGFGLWVAAYVDDNDVIPNYAMDVNRDPSPAWDGQVGDILWQFTSTGRLDGYGGNLDCNYFSGTRATWEAYAASHTNITAPVSETPPPPPVEATTTTEPTTTTTTTVAPPAEQPIDDLRPDELQPTVTTTTTTRAEAVSYDEPEEGAGLKAIKEFIRLVVFALPGLFVQAYSGDPALAVGVGAPFLAFLKALDKYIHENPNTTFNGLLPF